MGVVVDIRTGAPTREFPEARLVRLDAQVAEWERGGGAARILDAYEIRELQPVFKCKMTQLRPVLKRRGWTVFYCGVQPRMEFWTPPIELLTSLEQDTP